MKNTSLHLLLLVLRAWLLLCCPALLTGQTDNWQYFFTSNSLRDGAESEQYVWLRSDQALLQIDKNSGTTTIQSRFTDHLPASIIAIENLADNRVAALGQANDLYIWDGEWQAPIYINDPPQNYIYNIIGERRAGVLLLNDYQDIYEFSTDGSLIPLGLPVGSVGLNSVLLNADGHLWTWSNSSLFHFDAQNNLLAVETFENEYIFKSHLDAAGGIWVITQRKLFHRPPGQTTWQVITAEESGIAPGTFHLLTAPGGGIYAHSLWGIHQVQWQDNDFVVTDIEAALGGQLNLPEDYAYQDRTGRLWYWQHTRGKLCNWHPDADRIRTKGSLLIPQLTLRTVVFDPQGRAWLGGYGFPAYLDGGEWKTLIPASVLTGETPLPFLLSGNTVTDYVFARDGWPLFATDDSFVFGPPIRQLLRWNGLDQDTLSFTAPGSGFFTNTILHLDDDQNLWVGARFGGSFSVNSEGEWYHFLVRDVPPVASGASFFATLEPAPDGSVWLATDRALVRYDGFQFTILARNEVDFDDAYVQDISFAADGTPWVSLNDKGVKRLVNNTWEDISPPDDPDAGALTVAYVTHAPDGTAWVATTSKGVFSYQNGTWTPWNTTNSGLADDSPLAIEVDASGRVWFVGSQTLSIYSPAPSAPIRPLVANASSPLHVYPNPSSGLFTARWYAPGAGTYQLRLANAAGEVVQTSTVVVATEGSYQAAFNVPGLAAGTYFLQITQDGKMVTTAPLVRL
ncbi:MAG: T9SS type A sorting domain-containing protein [Bacteroidota bacterium]